MNWCFSCCVISFYSAIFHENRTIILLSDKLFPDISYGCLSSQEHVLPNYVPTQYCVLVMLYPVIVIRHITILNNYFADV